mmetsp:Transcript_13951/g.30154  ORF Transcript_13951/g.30154 Transcript_13951/m.30154 type:complete len:600 (+) Transcript_13951:88-1887(+)
MQLHKQVQTSARPALVESAHSQLLKIVTTRSASILSRQSVIRSAVAIDVPSARSAEIARAQSLTELEVDRASTSTSSGPVSTSAQELAAHLGIGPQHATALLSSHAALLQEPIESWKQKLYALAHVLSCTVQQAVSAVSKHPGLLETDLASVQAKLTRLSTELKASHPDVAHAVRRVPTLLDQDPITIKSHVQQLSDVLGVNTEAATKLALKEPLLLMLQIKEVKQKLGGVAEVLHLPRGSVQAAELACAFPGLLGCSRTSIEQKVHAIETALALQHSTACKLVATASFHVLMYSEERITKQLTALLELFTKQQLTTMLFREPSLFMRTYASVMERVTSMQQILGSKSAALDLAARRPSLLTKDSESLERSYRALSIWRLKPEEKQKLIDEHPLLLRLSPREVHHRCRWLRELMLSNGFYHSTLRDLPMKLVGVTVLHLPTVWGRLQYLAETNQETRMQLSEVIQCNERTFNAQFPEFRKWWSYKTSEMGSKVPWRKKQQHKRGRGPQGSSKAQQGDERAAAGTGSNRGTSSTAQAGIAGVQALQAPADAGAAPMEQGALAVVTEAATIYLGMQPLHKPRRVVYAAPSQVPPGSAMANP